MSDKLRNPSQKFRNPVVAEEYRKELVKSRKEPLSDDQTAFIEHCKRASADFDYFCRFMCGMRLHDGQKSVVKLMEEKDYGVLTAANGWGKTVFYALLALWASFGLHWAPGFWRRNYIAVILGPEMKHALLTHAEIEKIRNNRHEGQYWEGVQHQFALSAWLIPYRTRDGHEAFLWKHNKSQIRFESAQDKATSIEGWATNLIIYDEARLELYLEYIVNEVILARGTRVPGMRVLLGSTPLQDSYEFFEFFKRGERGDPDWWSRQGNIYENVFLDGKQIEKIRRNLDPRVVEQVLAGQFVEPPDSYFVRERVLECMDEADTPDDIDSFRGKYIRDHAYAGGLDTAVAEGSTADYSVVTIWDITEVPYRVILEKVFTRGTPTTAVVSYCDVLVNEFGCQIGYDATGPLGVELTNQVSNDPASYVPIRFTAGGHQRTGNTSKSDALATLRYFINNKLWSSPNLPGLKAEMIGYKIKDQHLRKDRLMAQVYAAWIAKDYLNLSEDGLYMNEFEKPYQGQDSIFAPVPQLGKTPLQEKYLQGVMLQDIIDEQRGDKIDA